MSTLAIKGGTPLRTEPFHAWPVKDDADRARLLEVFDSGNWSFSGPVEKAFSEKFAAFCGVKQAHCVCNGSVTLELALRALGVGPGDEVIVPGVTWIATAWAVVQVGATVRFADVSAHDWCIDPAAIEAAITSKTKVIIPVHLYNQVAEMDQIMAIADEHGLKVIEDCAHTHGSRWGDRAVGTIGHVGSFSFQQTKGMTSGEGGILVTDDDALAERIYGLKNCGRPVSPEHGPTFGSNYRITEFQAAILHGQLDRLEDHLATKAARTQLLRERMVDVPGITVLPQKEQVTRQGFYSMALHYDPAAWEGLPRDLVVDALRAEGLNPLFPPYEVVYKAHLYKPGARLYDYTPDQLGMNARCPVAERLIEHESLTLQHQLFLGPESDVEDIVAIFRKVQSHAGELKLDGLKKKARSTARNFLQKTGLKK